MFQGDLSDLMRSCLKERREAGEQRLVGWVVGWLWLVVIDWLVVVSWLIS